MNFEQGGERMSSSRNRFGIPGVIAVVALVFAMAGGAWAAKGVIITKLSQISPGVQKQLKGKQGNTGAAGSQGAAGPAGPAGPKGDAGAQGDKGATGAKGATGNAGPEGSPWTAGGTLPSGRTETGSWVAPNSAAGSSAALITFTIPLPVAELGPGVYMAEGEAAKPGCTGGTAKDPKANPGFLCVYTGLGKFKDKDQVATIKSGEALGATSAGVSKTGAVLLGEEPNGGLGFAAGTWAVTAP
jgi:hypothetical protein